MLTRPRLLPPLAAFGRPADHRRQPTRQDYPVHRSTGTRVRIPTATPHVSTGMPDTTAAPFIGPRSRRNRRYGALREPIAYPWTHHRPRTRTRLSRSTVKPQVTGV